MGTTARTPGIQFLYEPSASKVRRPLLRATPAYLGRSGGPCVDQFASGSPLMGTASLVSRTRSRRRFLFPYPSPNFSLRPPRGAGLECPQGNPLMSQSFGRKLPLRLIRDGSSARMGSRQGPFLGSKASPSGVSLLLGSECRRERDSGRRAPSGRTHLPTSGHFAPANKSLTAECPDKPCGFAKAPCRPGQEETSDDHSWSLSFW